MILEYFRRLPPRAVRLPFFTIALVFCSVTARAEVTISDRPTRAMKCDKGVCAPKKAKANLNVSDLANMLGAGDVKVVSNSAATDIHFEAPLSWTSARRLTLDSYRSIVFEQPVVATGKGALTIATDDGGTGGDFMFTGMGRIQFWDKKSSLVINGVSYTLVRTVAEFQQAVQFGCDCALRRDYDAKQDGTYTSSPLGVTFIGTIEGLGNAISNLTINAPSVNQVGFIAQLSDFNHFGVGTVRDLKLLRLSETASDSTTSGTGGIAGQNYGTISGVQVTGTVNTGTFVGGITAQNYGLVTESSFEGTLGGDYWTDYVGGLVGYNNDGKISNVSAHVLIAGVVNAQVGGIAGDNSGVLSNASSSGSIADGGFSGGIAGDNERQIKTSNSTASVAGGDAGGIAGMNGAIAVIGQSYAAGKVSGGSYTGGVVGFNIGTVTTSYGTGAVSAVYFAGGMVGVNEGSVSATYATGKVRASDAGFAGGAVGDGSDDNIQTTYWDLDTSGISKADQGCGRPPSCAGVAGLTDAQLKSAMPAGFDLAVWGQKGNINSGYPYLLANPPPK